MANEAYTCRSYVIPKLKSAGWDDDCIADLKEQRHIVAYLDCLYLNGHLRQVKVSALRELQSASGEEW